MSSERIDPELLAAFLEGTASPQEREEVLRTVARSGEAYAEFMEASAAYDDLVAADDRPTLAMVTPEPTAAPEYATKPRSNRPRWLVSSLLIAAAITGIVALPRLQESSEVRVIRLAQEAGITRETGTDALARQLGTAWYQPPWSTTRGSDRATASASTVFRAGVGFADLEIAFQARDSIAVERASRTITDLLQSIEGAAPLAESIRSLALVGDGSPSGRATVASELRDLLGGGEWFDLGVWTETARIAVLARDSRFFDPSASGVAELRRIIEKGNKAELGDDWNSATIALQSLIDPDRATSADLATIDQTIRSAMIAAAR